MRCGGKEARDETLDPTDRNRVLRRDSVGESAPSGDARHHRQHCGVDAAGLGGYQTFLSGEAWRGVGVNGTGWVPPTGMTVTLSLTCQESAEAVVPAGDVGGWEGLNVDVRGVVGDW